MTPHEKLDDQARERAALHALGCLDPEESRDYARHLDGCEACRAEVESHGRVVGELAGAGPETEAPPELRRRLMARLASEREEQVRVAEEGGAAARPAHPDVALGQTWKRWSKDRADGDLILLAAVDHGWEPTGAEGVETRRLFVDQENDRVTMLIRMSAGASYPPHRHAGPEECYVIAGDIDVGGTLLTAGSYQRVAAGSVHARQSTVDGCLLLIVSSMHDEIMDGPSGAVART